MSTTASPPRPTGEIVLTPAQASALLDEYINFEFFRYADDLQGAADRGIVEDVVTALAAVRDGEDTLRALHEIASGTEALPFDIARVRRDRLRELVANGLGSCGGNLSSVREGSPVAVPDVARTVETASALLGILEQLDASTEEASR